MSIVCNSQTGKRAGTVKTTTTIGGKRSTRPSSARSRTGSTSCQVCWRTGRPVIQLSLRNGRFVVEPDLESIERITGSSRDASYNAQPTVGQRFLHGWLSTVPRTAAQSDGGPALQLAGGQTEDVVGGRWLGRLKIFFSQRAQKIHSGASTLIMTSL